MKKPDWKTAPQDAMCFNDGAYWKVKFSSCSYSRWDNDVNQWVKSSGFERSDDYENNPSFIKALDANYGHVFALIGTKGGKE